LEGSRTATCCTLSEVPEVGVQSTVLGKPVSLGTTEYVHIPPLSTTALSVTVPPCGGMIEVAEKLLIEGFEEDAALDSAGVTSTEASAKTVPTAISQRSEKRVE
jgi:hypothetical protein